MDFQNLDTYSLETSVGDDGPAISVSEAKEGLGELEVAYCISL